MFRSEGSLIYLRLKVIKTAFLEEKDRRVLPWSSFWSSLGHRSDIRLKKLRNLYFSNIWNKDQKFPRQGCVLPFSPGPVMAGLLPSRRWSVWLFCILTGLLLALYFFSSSLKTTRRQIYIQNGQKWGQFSILHSLPYISTKQRSL